MHGPSGPMWPFGFGRSYTTFSLANLGLDLDRIPADGGEVVVSVEITNTGTRPGDEVVQLYARDVEASVARPVLELVGFRRVSLASGECRRVSFRLSAEQLAYTGADYRRVIEPGEVQRHVGTSLADLPLRATLTLTGPAVELVARRRFVTATSIS